MTSHQFSKINCGGKIYFLKTSISERHGHGIELVLSDTVNAWTGEMTEKNLDEWSKKAKMKRSDYEAETRVALTGGHDVDSQFEYIIADGKSTDMELSWKKIISEVGIKVQLGSVTLSRCSSASEAVREIFEFVIESISSFKHQMSALKTERDRLAAERETAITKLEKCATIKEDTENELYSKFVLVLNAKKEKLRQLRQNGCNSIDAAAVDNSSNIMTSTTSDLEPKPGTSRSDDNGKSNDDTKRFNAFDSDVDTDEEESSRNRTRGLKVRSGLKDDDSLQSADRPPADSSNDVSLVLGDESDVEPDDPVVVKRSRKSARSTKQPTKTIIPQVSKPKPPPLQSDTGKSRASVSKGSLKKLSSKLSNNSSNIDTDDLLDNLA